MKKRTLLRFAVALLQQALVVLGTPREEFPFNNQLPPVAHYGEFFQYTFSQDTFKSDERIVYSCPDLPSWCHFDADTRTLSGTPYAWEAADGIKEIEFTLLADDSLGTTSSKCKLLITNVPAPHVKDGYDIKSVLSASGQLSGPSSFVLTPGKDFEISFPHDFFTSDGRPVIGHYAVTGDHAPLPIWLHFDGQKGKFWGTAPPATSEIAPAQQFNILYIESTYQGFATISEPFSLMLGAKQFTTTLGTETVNITHGHPFSYVVPLKGIYEGSDQISTANVSSITAAIPANANWMSYDPQTNTISGTPPAGMAAGKINVPVTVVDHSGNTVNFNVLFTTEAPQSNTVFTASVLPPINAPPGTFLTYNLGPYVATGAEVQISAPGQSWITYVPANTSLQGVVPSNFDNTALVLSGQANGKEPQAAVLPVFFDPSGEGNNNAGAAGRNGPIVGSAANATAGATDNAILSSSAGAALSSATSSSTRASSSTSSVLNSASVTSFSGSSTASSASTSRASSSSASASSQSTSSRSSTSASSTNSSALSSDRPSATTSSPPTSSATASSTPTDVVPPAPQNKSHHSNTTAVAVGCGVAIPIGAVALLIALLLLYLRRRHKKKHAQEDLEKNVGTPVAGTGGAPNGSPGGGPGGIASGAAAAAGARSAGGASGLPSNGSSPGSRSISRPLNDNIIMAPVFHANSPSVPASEAQTPNVAPGGGVGVNWSSPQRASAFNFLKIDGNVPDNVASAGQANLDQERLASLEPVVAAAQPAAGYSRARQADEYANVPRESWRHTNVGDRRWQDARISYNSLASVHETPTVQPAELPEGDALPRPEIAHNLDSSIVHRLGSHKSSIYSQPPQRMPDLPELVSDTNNNDSNDTQLSGLAGFHTASSGSDDSRGYNLSEYADDSLLFRKFQTSDDDPFWSNGDAREGKVNVRHEGRDIRTVPERSHGEFAFV